MSGWLWTTPASQFDEAVDKATSELIPKGQEDIALSLEICDQIRSKAVPPKDAMRSIKRRLLHTNPNVVLLALGLADVCVKNGGEHLLVEVASKEFMDAYADVVKKPGVNHEVKAKSLLLLQNWAIAFESNSKLSYTVTIYRELKASGQPFPPKSSTATAAMVETTTAPEWTDSESCQRCRTPFSTFNRKHHCRNCGKIFDAVCCNKFIPLPHFGITQAVRVCEGCHAKLTRGGGAGLKRSSTTIAPSRPPASAHVHTRSTSISTRKTGADDMDPDLARAIALSLAESAAHERAAAAAPSEPPIASGRREVPDGKLGTEDEDDPDLRAAIEASIREMNAPKPSAPAAVPEDELPRQAYNGYTPYTPYDPYRSASTAAGPSATPVPPPLPSFDLDIRETDTILSFAQTVEQAQAQGAVFPQHAAPLYDQARGLQPKLVQSVDDAARKEQTLSDMHAKLSEAVRLYNRLLEGQIEGRRNAAAAYVQPQPYAAPPEPVYASHPTVASPAPAPPAPGIYPSLHAAPSVATASEQPYAPYSYAPVPQQQWAPAPAAPSAVGATSAPAAPSWHPYPAPTPEHPSSVYPSMSTAPVHSPPVAPEPQMLQSTAPVSIAPPAPPAASPSPPRQAPPQPQTQPTLQRALSHPVAHSQPQQQQQQQQYHPQQQQYSALANLPSVPSLPSVPASLPSPPYGHHAHTHAQPQEAMLIEL